MHLCRLEIIHCCGSTSKQLRLNGIVCFTMAIEKEYPFYLKSTVILFGLILLVYIFSVLGNILVPLAFAAFLAILLNPLVNKLLAWKVPKILAIIGSLLLAVLFIAALFYFLSTQIAQFSESFP